MTSVSLNSFDIVLLIILALSTLFGLWRGFVKEVAALIVLLLAVALAFIFAKDMAIVLQRYVDIRADIATIAGFLVIFVVVWLIAATIAYFITKGMSALLGASFINYFLGAVFGLLRGGLFILLIVFVINGSFLQTSNWFQQSKIVAYAQPIIKRFTLSETTVSYRGND
ncbi:MAG: CvpA family protein [Pseudomonadota bacterium]